MGVGEIFSRRGLWKFSRGEPNVDNFVGIFKIQGCFDPAPPSDAHELVHNVFHYWVLSVATQRSYFLSKTCVHQRAKVNSLSVIY